MSRRKIIITVNIVLLVVYILVASIVIFKYSEFPKQYEKIEKEYVEQIEEKLNVALGLNETEMVAALDKLQEEYAMEIIVEDKGKSVYQSINLQQSTSYMGSMNEDSILFEMQGYVENGSSRYFVWFAIYHLSSGDYLSWFINQQNILFIISFLVLLVALFVVQWLLVRPLFKISESVKKASEYQFDEIDAKATDDNVTKDFSKFVHRLRGSISAVSRKHTELESQLQYERERLSNTIVVSKALVHDLKSPVHQLMIENEFQKDHILKENEEAHKALDYNIEKTESILLDINNILKMMNNDYNVLEETELFDIVEIAVETTKLFQASLMEKDLYFLLDAPEKLLVYMNKVNMKLLIHNIISNAYQYAQRDSEINFKIELNDYQIIIECKNSSNQEDIERMNRSEQLFNVVESQHEGNIYSSGNGLFLIKDLTAMFNGEYQMGSEGDIVTVVIQIPVQRQGASND